VKRRVNSPKVERRVRLIRRFFKAPDLLALLLLLVDLLLQAFLKPIAELDLHLADQLLLDVHEFVAPFVLFIFVVHRACLPVVAVAVVVFQCYYKQGCAAMANQSLEKLEGRIIAIRAKIAGLGDMRPGSLTRQYRKPQEGKQPFHQLSYTHEGKSRSDYVRAENLQTIRREIKEYKRFRKLSETLVTLSIKASRLRCKTR